MFYKSVNKKSNKEMFDFLKQHFTYYTLNSWNGLKSIANNVKIYNLQLEGDGYRALDILSQDDFIILNRIIRNWEKIHPGYEVRFNGHSDGYLVLYNSDNSRSILPFIIEDFETYEDLKAALHSDGDTISGISYDLKKYTRLVQDFDLLCDELRNEVNRLSKT